MFLTKGTVLFTEDFIGEKFTFMRKKEKKSLVCNIFPIIFIFWKLLIVVCHQRGLLRLV